MDVPDELADVHDVVGGEVGDVADVDVSLVGRRDGGLLLDLGARAFGRTLEDVTVRFLGDGQCNF